MSKADELMIEAGMRPIPDGYFAREEWYDWLINEYIPGQGREDMGLFLGPCKFDPIRYVMAKLKMLDLVTDEQFDKFIQKMIAKYGEEGAA